MTIEISALDTLFFRDGKPFSMGDDTWATGVFPPLPSVFYGMIRTAFASQNNIVASDIEARTENLKITSILLKLDDEIIYPYPADLFSTKKLAEENKARNLELFENKTLSNIKKEEYSHLLSTKTNEKVTDFSKKAFISAITFEEYLSGEKEHSFINIDKIITSEAKIGIGKDLSTNITSEGKLYRVGMKRLEYFDAEKPENSKKLHFVVEYENLELGKIGIVKLGAEGKTARYQTIRQHKISMPKIDKYLKIYLASPAIFKDGNSPNFIKERNLEGIGFDLLTCSIGKPIYVGGFDMKKREPKIMQKAVPAGSVYYIKSDNALELAKKLHGKSISEQMQEQGFGICYCGTFNI